MDRPATSPPDASDELFQFRKRIYNAFDPAKPLDGNDPRYVPLDGTETQPGVRGVDFAADVAQQIQLADAPTATLFAGFSGSGKTTELKRLAARLERAGYSALFVDADQYFNMALPVDVETFVVSMAGAFAQAAESILAGDLLDRSPAQRVVEFFKSLSIGLDELEVGGDVAGVGVKVVARLRESPEFRHKVVEKLRRRPDALYREFDRFVNDGVAQILARKNTKGVVFILDSLEKLRGPSDEDAKRVFDSVRQLFCVYARVLRFGACHVVYSVPLYLPALVPNVAAQFGGDLRVLPMTKVRERGTRLPVEVGIRALTDVVVRRASDWRRLLGDDDAAIRKLIDASGGYLRDLFKMIRAVVVGSDGQPLPASDGVIEGAITKLRKEYSGIVGFDRDYEWLERVMSGRYDETLPEHRDVPRLLDLIDGHMVLAYENGKRWYDVHPLVRETLERRSKGV
jgi:hypothetical protein